MADEYGSSTTTMRVTLRQLERLRQNVGASGGKTSDQIRQEEANAEEERRKIAALSPYQRAEYSTAKGIQQFRELMKNLEEMDEAPTRVYTVSDKARARQQARKLAENLTKMSRDAIRVARSEKKDAECKELIRHVDNAKRMYRAKFSLQQDGSNSFSESEAPAALTPINSANRFNDAAPLLSSDGYGSNQNFGTSLRQEEEFQQFYVRLQEQDHIVDKQLDRILIGVTRLKENAELIQTELKVQDTMIDEVERKVDKSTQRLKGLNAKLKETLKQVDSSKMCVYFFCFIVLLGVVGAALYFSGIIGPKSKN